jgi:hypothetical protein
MNRIVLGILCVIAFGVIDVLMIVFGNHPDRTTGMLLQAFSSRFEPRLVAESLYPSTNCHPEQKRGISVFTAAIQWRGQGP